jgi:hypothetical protein
LLPWLASVYTVVQLSRRAEEGEREERAASFVDFSLMDEEESVDVNIYNHRDGACRRGDRVL